MNTSCDIAELMCPGAIHDLGWLKRALQAAIKIEFTTIPPYLCGLWSIKDERHPFACSIREVVQEEMLHMALASNLLAAIGGTPSIRDAVPVYPCPLPGGVHSGLEVQLARLSPKALKVFLRIERPDEPLRIGGPDPGHLPPTKAITIGEFYEAILKAFRDLKPALTPEGQLPGRSQAYGKERKEAWKIILTMEDVEDAISTIMHQGEGMGDTPADTGEGDLSHYYRFLEMRKKRRIVLMAGRWKFGDAYPMPEILPMADIPEGGYRQADVSAEIWRLLTSFDTTFTTMVTLLDSAWRGQGYEHIVRAMEVMFRLQADALPLMRTTIPGRDQTYGPCFRIT